MPADLNPDPSLLDDVLAAAARHWTFLPLQRNADGSVTIAVAEPENTALLDNVSALYGAPVVPVARPRKDLEADLRAAFGLGAAAADQFPPLADAIESNPGPNPQPTGIAAFVDAVISQAIQDGATDIHIEPFEDDLRVRFRIDGILHDVPTPAALARRGPYIVSRIKVMSRLDIAERRAPQDGRMRFSPELDIRVSTLPTVYGESVDLRLLPAAGRAFALNSLGLSEADLATISSVVGKPHGLVLVTGPTGHGKTTTLYACLSKINTAEKKIITVEDPVEIRLRGINQVEVRSAGGLTFATGLRSILRQDPDVIMVGEVRDLETAEVAIRAALTGHLVFSTLHTSDAVGAVARLVDMGIQPYLASDALVAIVAQRLVRRRCPMCAGPSSGGCEACRATGYRGRTGIFEILLVDDAIRVGIGSRAGGKALREMARRAGMRTLQEDGMEKAARGVTTAEEVRRVGEAS